MASRWSMSVSAAPTCLSKTARRSISACRPNASARRRSSAPRARSEAQEIRSRADREVTVLVAEATSKSEQIRGEGDAMRNQIFADAFNQDPDFFAFYRSMQAYENGLKQNDTRMRAEARFKLLPLFHRSLRQMRAANSASPAQPASGAR